MSDRKKLRPPSPAVEAAPPRKVEIPATVGALDTTAGDQLPLQKTRASFREEEFIRALRQHGKYVVWRKALLCPCMSAETEQAQLACPDCGGGGYLYVDPLPIQALMLQFDKKTSIYEKFGLWQEGNVQVTVEPKYRLGYRDSLEMLDTVMPMNELLVKGERRGRRAALPAGVDSARFRIEAVAKIMHRDRVGRIHTLEQGVHFTLTDEGWIRWTSAGDRLVPEGGVLTIHYDFHPIFLVLSWMHVARDDVSGRKATPQLPRVIGLPVQAMAKLLFLADSNSVPSFDAPVRLPTGVGPGGFDG